ncbi:hypothetical protein LVJ94_17260 [Pendulispora rubella]|uniref:Lipoprotein n=1 Tax=Pendulispora rubella TaxID=2741070 RepID=A0ABZ2LGR9_9BACT
MHIFKSVLLMGSMAFVGIFGCANDPAEQQARGEVTSIDSSLQDVVATYFRFDVLGDNPSEYAPRSFVAAREFANEDQFGRWHIEASSRMEDEQANQYATISTTRTIGTFHCDAKHVVAVAVWYGWNGVRHISATRNMDCEITVTGIDPASGLVEGTAHGTLQFQGQSMPFSVEFAVHDFSVPPAG